MAILFNQKQEPTILPEGWHYARVEKIMEGTTANTRYGESNRVLITFLTEHGGIVTHSFLMAAGVNRMLVNLVTVTIGEGTGEVDLEDLVGKFCGINLEHRYGQQDRLFVNVVDVCSTDQFVDDESGNDSPDDETGADNHD